MAGYNQTTEVSIDRPRTAQGEYWAAEQDINKFASELRCRIDEFRNASTTSGRVNLWRRAIRLYYGLDADGGWKSSHVVTFNGSQGQIVELRANLFRAIVRSALVMTSGSRPSFSCRAIAYDAATNENVKIGNAMLDRCLDDGVERTMIDANENMMILGEGATSVTWDDSAGRVVGVDQETGRIAHAGALRVRSHRPDEVVRDPNVLNPDDHRWAMLCVQRNRWELAALYPMYRGEILSAESDRYDWIFEVGPGTSTRSSTGADDTVLTYEFYHAKTDAVPDGRAAILVGDCVIADTLTAAQPFPYDELPVAIMRATREPLSTFGYAEAWELMALQAAFDSILTQVVTTRENFGFQKFFVQAGVQYTKEALSEAFSIIEGAAPPIPLDFSDSGVDSGLNMMNAIRGTMQMILGMNDVAMGDASKSQSGAALAQMQQIASQFNSQNQFAYVAAFESVMNKVLRVMKSRASEAQIVQIAGKNNVYSVREFRSEGLASLDGVKVEIGSAALRTTPMRHQIAQELAANPLQPITPDQFLTVVATGRLEPVESVARTQETLAERLIVEVQEGRGYQPAMNMPHHIMLPRLTELMSQPGIEPQTYQAASALIQAHVGLWQSGAMTPEGQTLFAALGIPVPAGLAMLQAQQAAMMAPPPDAMGGQAPQGNPDQMPTGTAPSAPMGPNGPSLPNLPANAAPIPPMS